MKVKFKKFSSLARVSTKSTPDSACYDVLLVPGAKKCRTRFWSSFQGSTFVESIQDQNYL